MSRRRTSYYLRGAAKGIEVEDDDDGGGRTAAENRASLSLDDGEVPLSFEDDNSACSDEDGDNNSDSDDDFEEDNGDEREDESEDEEEIEENSFDGENDVAMEE